jgi:CheY-like chemotaxis protein
MSIRHTALVGFSQFETMTLESFFRLAGRRPPGYLIVPAAKNPHVLIVNADNAQVVAELKATPPVAEVILIGAPTHGLSFTTLQRPIRLLAVLDEIEKLMQRRAEAAPASVATPAPAPAQAVVAPVTAPVAPPVNNVVPLPDRSAFAAPAPVVISTSSTPSSAPAVVVMPPPPAKVPSPVSARPTFGNSRGGLLGFGNSESPSMGAPSTMQQDDVPDDHILVVDDSDIVLRFMQGRLQRFGYAVELASSGEQAIERVQAKAFKFVFLDVMMPGIDGYQACRSIKKMKYPNDGKAPTVVMLSSRGGSIDKIRGTLAGADAYLTKPLAEAALLKVLADHDEQTANNFSSTRPHSGIRQ